MPTYATTTAIHQGTARVPYAVCSGIISMRETRTTHQVQLGALKKRGAINFGHGDGNPYAVTDEVAYAFDIDD